MRFIRYSLAYLAGITTALVVSMIALGNSPAPVWPLPLDWVTDTFPQGVEACPGERIPYKLAILEQVEGPVALYDTIDRAPNHPRVEAVRSTELAQALVSQHGVGIVGDTVEIEKSPSWVILGGDDRSGSGLRVDIDSTMMIPEDLEAGPYVRKLAVVWVGRPSEAAIRLQRFVVKPKGDCQ